MELVYDGALHEAHQSDYQRSELHDVGESTIESQESAMYRMLPQVSHEVLQ